MTSSQSYCTAFFSTQPGAMQCPCRRGMTCSKRKGKDSVLYGKGYGRCVYITPGPDEIDEDRPLPRFS